MQAIKATISARISTASAEYDGSNSEFDRIIEFLKNHPHEFVADRQRHIVEDAFDAGNILLVEVPNNGGFSIEGCAFIYELLESSYVEIGTINIPGLGGFDLQKLLIVLSACRFILPNVKSPPKVFATINRQNERQYGKLVEAFMLPWENPPDELLSAKGETVQRGAEDPAFFLFDENQINNACAYLEKIVDDVTRPTRTNRYTKIPETLTFSSIDHFVVRRLMGLVREAAKQA